MKEEIMSLLEKLVFNREKENLVECLKQETLPLFIWGSGNIAELIRKYLLQNDIQVMGIFEWPTVYHKIFHNDVVHSLAEIKESYTQYNVIVGHSHYSKAEELLKNESGIRNIYFAFSFDYCGNNCNTFFECNVIKENIQRYEMVYQCMEDKASRENLVAFLNTKITGDVQYIFNIFEREMSIFENDIYFLSEKECYWNIGGGRGETISEFLKNRENQFMQIVTLEPDFSSFEFLCDYVDSLKCRRKIVKYQKVAWNKRKRISFYHDDDVVQSGSVELNTKGVGEETIEGIPLDELLCEHEGILPPTLITANYFSGIIEMLEGSRVILEKFSPKLAIVVGHNDEYGILRSVEAIRKANPEYKLYLRFHQALATTLVLYAVVKSFDL